MHNNLSEREVPAPPIKFLYNEPALLISHGAQKYLVIGDLHIGAEARFREKGVHIYSFAEAMAKKVAELLERFGAKNLILLGDVKESILYPDEVEAKSIRAFFKELSGYKIRIVEGNHDAHLSEVIGMEMEKEITIGGYALLHGNAWPSATAMSKRYIISAHNHIAVSMKDRKGGSYHYKAWLVSHAGPGMEKYYPQHNKEIRLVSMPAFNDLIMGINVAKFFQKENLNPLFRNSVFDYESSEVYLLSGEFAGTVHSLSQKPL